MSLPYVLVCPSSWDPDVPGLGSASPSGCSGWEILPLDVALWVYPPCHFPSEWGGRGDGGREREGESVCVCWGEGGKKGKELYFFWYLYVSLSL